MGLFSKKRREPLDHPPVVRRIFVHADATAVAAQMASYDELSPRTEPSTVSVLSEQGWTAVVLPERIHPWAFHNLAMWLMDTGGGDGADVVAVAEVAADAVGYWLVNDEHDSWMSGYDDRGNSVTVSVPDNSWVRGDALDHPAATAAQTLTARGVPTELWGVTADSPASTAATVRLEDPQHDLNPSLDTSYDTRKKMGRVSYGAMY